MTNKEVKEFKALQIAFLQWALKCERDWCLSSFEAIKEGINEKNKHLFDEPKYTFRDLAYIPDEPSFKDDGEFNNYILDAEPMAIRNAITVAIDNLDKEAIEEIMQNAKRINVIE